MAGEADRKATYIAMWEAQGVEATRLQILTAQTWAHGVKNLAIQWVDDRDHERLARMDASTSEQILLARNANRIATQAKIAAIVAAIAAIIGAIAAIIPLFLH